jgi:hypothetical protein
MWLDPAKPAVGVWGEGSTPFYKPPHRSSQMTVSRQYDLSELPEAHAVAFTPIVTRVPGLTPDGAITHHMTLLLCTDAVRRYPVVTRSLPSLDHGAPCQELIYQYDRDAGPVVLPENVGFRLGGKGALYTTLVLEIHYLLPGLDISSLRKKIQDRSGVVVTCTTALRAHNAGLSGMVDRGMKLPPGQASYLHSYTTKKGVLARRLRADLALADHGGLSDSGLSDGDLPNGLRVFAVHLHAHDHARKIWLSHFRSGRKVGDFGSLESAGGYGPSQDWFLLLDDRGGVRREGGVGPAHFLPGNADAPTLTARDQLRGNCVYDTLHATPFTVSAMRCTGVLVKHVVVCLAAAWNHQLSLRKR